MAKLASVYVCKCLCVCVGGVEGWIKCVNSIGLQRSLYVIHERCKLTHEHTHTGLYSDVQSCISHMRNEHSQERWPTCESLALWSQCLGMFHPSNFLPVGAMANSQTLCAGSCFEMHNADVSKLKDPKQVGNRFLARGHFSRAAAFLLELTSYISTSRVFQKRKSPLALT